VALAGSVPAPSEGVTSFQPLRGPIAALSLEEAITLSLEHDPNVHLAREQSLANRERVVAASGLFDSTFSANLSFTLESSALSRSEIQFEENKRKILREVERETQRVADALRDELDSSTGLIFPDCPPGQELVITGADGTDIVVCTASSASDRADQQLLFDLAARRCAASVWCRPTRTRPRSASGSVSATPSATA
jgi:hypothetical protein